jgi:hypothetical protein
MTRNFKKIIVIYGLLLSVRCWALATPNPCDSMRSVDSWHDCFGTTTHKSNQKYQGYFRYGKPDGMGVTTFANGYHYIGNFKKGEYDGLGVIADKNEKVVQGGLWESGGFVEPRQLDIAQLKRDAQISGDINSVSTPDSSQQSRVSITVQNQSPAPQPVSVSREESAPQKTSIAQQVLGIKSADTETLRLTTISNKNQEPSRSTEAKLTPNIAVRPVANNIAHTIKKTIQTSGRKRLALVIGNDTYQSVSKLENAREDARVIAQSFERLGYQVTLQIDLNEKQMKAAFRNFTALVEGGDEVVIFYAGHGVQLSGANYLLPIDIAGDSEAQVRDEAIQLQKILDDMSDRKAKFTLAVLDACRDNPFKSSGRAIGGRGLANTTAATGQMIVFSAGSGQQALDKLGPTDKSKNGLFTRIFVNEIQKPGLTIDRVIKNVRKEVVDAAKSVNHEQVPSIYDQVVGDFYFIPQE